MFASTSISNNKSRLRHNMEDTLPLSHSSNGVGPDPSPYDRRPRRFCRHASGIAAGGEYPLVGMKPELVRQARDVLHSLLPC
jgi:hypothetical protein